MYVHDEVPVYPRGPACGLEPMHQVVNKQRVVEHCVVYDGGGVVFPTPASTPVGARSMRGPADVIFGELQEQLIARARDPWWHHHCGGLEGGGGVSRAPPPLLFLGLLLPGGWAVRGRRQRCQMLGKPTQVGSAEPLVEPLGCGWGSDRLPATSFLMVSTSLPSLIIFLSFAALTFFSYLSSILVFSISASFLVFSIY